MKVTAIAWAAAATVHVFPARLSADVLDPALERLSLNSASRAPGGVDACSDEAGRTTGTACVRDQVAFTRLVNQWGFAFAPNAISSSRPNGPGNFELSLSGQFTRIDQGAEYWQLGTKGSGRSAGTRGPVSDDLPPLVELYALNARKGVGFGLELQGAVGFLRKSHLLSYGMDARISCFDWLRSPAWPDAIPDLKLGGGVRTVTGAAELRLMTAAADVQLTRAFTVAGSSVVRTWLGYQYLWILATSREVDLTPGTDPLGYCNYTGENVPGNWDETKTTADGEPLYDGQPVCLDGSGVDFENTTRFDAVRLERQRLLVGANYRHEMVLVGLEFITDLLLPENSQVGSEGTRVRGADGQVREDPDRGDPSPATWEDADLLAGVPRQWTLVAEIGVAF